MASFILAMWLGKRLKMSREEFERQHKIYLEQQREFLELERLKKSMGSEEEKMADPGTYTPPGKVNIKLDIDDVDIE